MSETEDSRPGGRPELGRWRHIFERSLNPMLIADDDRSVLDANAAACLLLRKRRDDLRGLKVDDFTPPEGRAQLRELFAALVSAGTDAGPFTLLCSDKLRLDEREVLTLLALGDDGEQIAAQLTRRGGSAQRELIANRAGPRIGSRC